MLQSLLKYHAKWLFLPKKKQKVKKIDCLFQLKKKTITSDNGDNP